MQADERQTGILHDAPIVEPLLARDIERVVRKREGCYLNAFVANRADDLASLPKVILFERFVTSSVAKFVAQAAMVAQGGCATVAIVLSPF